MNDRLVTVATFWSPIEANLARNQLEAAGIRATLVGEETVGMAWHLANAIGGVQLQVLESTAEAALTVLGEQEPLEAASAEEPEPTVEPNPYEEKALSSQETVIDELEPELTSLEQDAARAYRAAILGLICLPLQFYVFWLVLKILTSDEPLRRERSKFFVAALINFPLMFLFCLGLRLMFASLVQP